MALWLPDSRFELPELFSPNRKPVGNVKINWSHPLTKGLVAYWLVNNNGELVELVSGTLGVKMGTAVTEISPPGVGIHCPDGTANYINYPDDRDRFYMTEGVTAGVGFSKVAAPWDWTGIFRRGHAGNDNTSKQNLSWNIQGIGGSGTLQAAFGTDASVNDFITSDVGIVPGGALNHAIISHDLVNKYIFLNGTHKQSAATGSPTSFLGNADLSVYFGRRGASSDDMTIFFGYVYERSLLAMEKDNMYFNPYQVLIPA